MRKPGTRKLLATLLLLLLLLLFFGYYKLGGLNKVHVQLVNIDGYHLVGRYFEGAYQSDTVRTYFNEMKAYLENGTFDGQPAIIIDQEPTGNRGLSKSFIGIRLAGSPSQLQDLEKREIPASQCIRVSKDAHISVMPNPDKIERLIQSFAKKHQLKITGSSIETYYPNNRIVIERPVLTNE